MTAAKSHYSEAWRFKFPYFTLAEIEVLDI